jgi:hypothetical protein
MLDFLEAAVVPLSASLGGRSDGGGGAGNFRVALGLVVACSRVEVGMTGMLAS